jgi:hypothetical protein
LVVLRRLETLARLTFDVLGHATGPADAAGEQGEDGDRQHE